MNVLTVKFGDKYPSSHVNKLYDDVGGNFYCYTDDSTDLNPNIKVIPIDDSVEGVWHKLAMFRKDFGGIKGKIMYLDLDLVIQKDIKELYNQYNTFTMVECYWKPLKELYNNPHYSIVTDMNINSSVMIWNQNENVHIWDFFIDNPEYYMLKHLYGIDRFLFWERLAPNSFFKKYDIYSRRYGISAEDGWYKRSPSYFVKDAFICLMNGQTTKKDYIELKKDINKRKTLSI